MKKRLLLLLIVMSVVLTACGEKSSEEAGAAKSKESRKAVEAVEEEIETEVNTETEIETESAVEETQETTVEESAEETTEALEDTEKFSKGIITETGWESEWLGMRYVTPEGKTLATEEELNEMMGLSQEVLSDDFNEWQLKYAELSTVYELMCVAEDGATNVTLAVEKMPITMEMDAYVEALKNTLSQITAISLTIVSDDEVITIGGKEFRQISSVASYEGIEMYQDYNLAIMDNRVVCVTVTYTDPAMAESILSGFEAY